MRFLRGLIVALGIIGPAAPAAAQMQLGVVQTGVAVVDQELLFSGSEYGQSILRGLEQASAELAAENRQIEAELETEERALTDARATLSVEEFRDKAGAFDAKVVGIRRAQDEKAQNLARLRDTEQQRFFQEVFPILTAAAAERGTQVVLDKRFVILSIDSIDLTQDIIARIDATLPEPGR